MSCRRLKRAEKATRRLVASGGETRGVGRHWRDDPNRARGAVRECAPLGAGRGVSDAQQRGTGGWQRRRGAGDGGGGCAQVGARLAKTGATGARGRDRDGYAFLWEPSMLDGAAARLDRAA